MWWICQWSNDFYTWIQQKARRKQKREEKEQGSRRRRVDTWMSPEALQGGGEKSRRREDGWKGGQFLSAVPSYECVCAVMCVCVCSPYVHWCWRSWTGGQTRWTYRDTHTNDRIHPLASWNHNSAVLLIACYSTCSILTLKLQHKSIRCSGHGKCPVLQNSIKWTVTRFFTLWASLFFELNGSNLFFCDTDFHSYQLIHWHFVVIYP